MLETILIAMLIAKLKRYKLKPLFKSWTVYPMLTMVFIYIFLNIGIFFGNYSFVKYAGVLETIYTCTFLFLILKYELYGSAITGAIAIFIGSMMNKAAIAANNGKMPVFPTLSYLTGYAKPEAFGKADDIHIIGNEMVKLKFLTDFIDIGYSVLSIGDIFIRFFTFIIVYNAIVRTNEIKTEKTLNAANICN